MHSYAQFFLVTCNHILHSIFPSTSAAAGERLQPGPRGRAPHRDHHQRRVSILPGAPVRPCARGVQRYAVTAVHGSRDRTSDNILVPVSLCVVSSLTNIELRFCVFDCDTADLIPSECICIRDGQPTRVPASKLTVGDLVKLEIGIRVPADMRVCQSAGVFNLRAVRSGAPPCVRVEHCVCASPICVYTCAIL